MEPRKYRVRVARPIFQFAVIEVEAGTIEEATIEALYQAEDIPEDAWVGEFDSQNYSYDVQYVENACIVEPEEGNDDEDYIFRGIDEDRKYLLLKADTDVGEGEVLLQPWIEDITHLMVADLCDDWTGQLEEVGEEGVSKFDDWLEQQVERPPRKPAKVLPFKRLPKPEA